jgi:competence protein ComEC
MGRKAAFGLIKRRAGTNHRSVADNMPSQPHSFFRAPSLYLLVGMVVGFCLARQVDAPFALTLAMAAALACISWKIAPSRPLVWSFCFLLAATLSAWNYAGWRLPEPPGQTVIDRPVREAWLHFEVTQVLQARTSYGSASGLARIVEAGQTSRLSRGDRVYFQLKLPQTGDFELLRGSEIQARGLIDAIDADRARPNSFAAYLVGSGIYHRFTRGDFLAQVKAPSPFETFCQRMNQHFEAFLRLGAPPDGELEGIYVAMLLGQKAALTDEQGARFRASGTMHFFAISGLHIGVIATVLAQFLLLLRVPRKLSPFIGLPLLYLYVEITGAPPSAVRAFLMALFFWLGFAFCRQRSALAALSASAVFVLIVAPGQLWSLGFQLSYTVVLSILLFGLPLYQFASERLTPFAYLPKADWSIWQRIYAPAQDAFLLVFSVSFSAWLASAPLSAAFFGYFSPSAILLNVLLVNLVAVAIITGVISLASALIGLTFLATFINHAAWLTIEVMDQLVRASTEIPLSVLKTPNFGALAAYSTLFLYFALLLLRQQKALSLGQSNVLFILPPAIILAGLLSAWL